MDVRLYLALFLRRLPLFLVVLIIGSAAGIALARWLPPVYVAQARLLVESEQIPDQLAASTVQTQAIEQIQIIQQRILTRDVLIEMANRLQIYAPVPGLNVRRPANPDRVVEDLRTRIRISVTGGASTRGGAAQATIVTVSFDAPTAILAATVTNEVVTLMLREDVSMRTSVARQTLEFFEQEVRRLDQELTRRGAAVLEFKERNRDALPDSLEFRRARLAAEQERLVQIERQETELAGIRAQIERLEQTNAALPGNTGPQQSPEERQLRALRDELQAQLAVLSPQNPRIRMLEAQIAALERVVAAQTGSFGTDEGGAPLSPFRIRMAEIDSQLAYLADQKARIRDNMAAIEATIAATPANDIALQTLERDLANVRRQYDEMVASKAKAETGDIIEALSKGQRISVIEQAVPPREPVRPNRPLIAAAGVGGGLVLGLALVVLIELMRPGIRSPAELTARLGIAPLAVVPYIVTSRERLRRRLRATAVTILVLAALAGAAWVVHVRVIPLDDLWLRIEDRFLVALPRPVRPA